MSGRDSPTTELWPNDVLAQGTLLHGYRITRILGRGGFGVTYLAEDLLAQTFAIKEYFPRQFAVRQGAQVHAASQEETGVFDECRERFVHEARALVGLGRGRSAHDDIVKVQTFFEANGTAYMVMEFVLGKNLQAVLREFPGGMPEDALRPLLANLLSGLSAVHGAGLMHRDIKPANILIRDDGRPVLIDFGSSREAGSQQTHGFTQIFSGGYAPPEQILGTRQGVFSDIYAVGVVGYEAIGGKTVDALARQQASLSGVADPMPPAAQIGAGRYGAGLLAAIDAALALNAADRPASAAEMVRLLRTGGRDGDDTVVLRPARPAREPAGQAKPARSRAPIYAGSAIAAALLLAAGGWLFTHRFGSAPPPPALQASLPTPTAVPASPPAEASSPSPAALQPVLPMPAAAPTAPLPSQPAPASADASPQPAATPVTPEPAPPAVTPPAPQEAAAPPIPGQSEKAPEPAPTVATPPPTPTQPPQIASLPPPDQPRVVDPFVAAPDAARAQPCAWLRVDLGATAPEADGIALAGPPLDGLRRSVSDIFRTAGTPWIDRLQAIEPGHCPAAIALGGATQTGDLRLTRAGDLPLPPRLGLPPNGGSFQLAAHGLRPGLVYADLYTADGKVRHLPTVSHQGGGNLMLTLPVSDPPGLQVLVVTNAAAALLPPGRPQTESAAPYADLIQNAARGADPTPQTGFATLLAAARPPPPAVTPSRVPTLNAPRCADIVARVQLGETLSDADRTTLRTACKP